MAAVLAGLASIANGAPIVYYEWEIASGQIGDTTFTDAFVQVTMHGDTDNVVSVFGFAVANPISDVTVSVGGIGTAVITGPTAIFASIIPLVLDDGFPELPAVVMATLDSPSDLESLTGLGFQASDALLGYDLRTAIGPISGIPGGVGYPTRLFVNTTLGALSFTTNRSPEGEGTFLARMEEVPEPASGGLEAAGIGVLVAGMAARTRARRRCHRRG